MRRSRFTEEQSIGILKEHEAAVPASDLRRKHGVSTADDEIPFAPSHRGY